MFSTTVSTLFVTLLAATGTLAAPTTDANLQKRVDLSCQDNGGGKRPVGEAQNCVDYLFNKGGDSCEISGENGIFCEAGDTVISGSNISGKPSAASLCRDVAYGVQAIIDSCTSNGQVAGYNAAGGNGELIVSINHK